MLQAHTLVWGAGLQAHPLAGSLGVELERGNRIPVGPDLSLAGHPEVFAVGDIAWITDAKTGDVLPQLGSVALQAGEHVGETIARLLAAEETEPFAYHDKGTMATIGRGAAVIQFAARSDDEGQDRVSGLGGRSPGAALDRRGPDQGDARLDLGRLYPRAREPDRRRLRRRGLSTASNLDLSADEFELLFDSVSNWGRWGSDDERGALNLLTPGDVVAAAGLVRSGEAVTLSLPLNTRAAIDNPEPADHRMTMLDRGRHGSGPVRFAKDYIGLDYHHDGHSHIDALCHVASTGSSTTGARGTR